MPPSFARARRRPPEQMTSTTEETYFTSYESLFVCASIILSLLFKIEHLTFSSILDDVVDTLVHGDHTHGFSQHQVQDSCQNTGTHHFCCHCCTRFKDMAISVIVIHFVPVHSVDHNTTSSPSVCLLLPSQKSRTAFHLCDGTRNSPSP